MHKTREELIDIAAASEEFLLDYPKAPIDIQWYHVWVWSYNVEEFDKHPAFDKYKYLILLNKKLPSPLRLNLSRDIELGEDREKKVQALLKIYGDK